jgi:adenine phosphoribosyltransferase
MTHDPEALQSCIDIFVRRYAKLEIDFIAGLDARGFILGPPIALALKKPFVMIRKSGKLPNATTGQEYHKEYKEAHVQGAEVLCVSRTVSSLGTRALVIDDLIATGGTLIAACDLLTSIGATVVECACIVELLALGGAEKLKAKHPDTKVILLIDFIN